MLDQILQILQVASIAIYLGALSVSAFVIDFVYMTPFAPLMDAVWMWSRAVRALFSYQLQGSAEATGQMDAASLIRAAGFGCAEHSVVTRDGWVLGMQRIVPRQEERSGARVPPSAAELESLGLSPLERASTIDAELAGTIGTEGGRQRSPSRVLSPPRGETGAKRPPVLFLHGMLMCSELWLVPNSVAPPYESNSLPVRGDVSDGESRPIAPTLPFLLAAAGYDVWLGNVRGNKYSSKHLSLKPKDQAYWDWSLDEFARLDVPAMIRHILLVTGSPRISYVGFSQASIFYGEGGN